MNLLYILLCDDARDISFVLELKEFEGWYQMFFLWLEPL